MKVFSPKFARRVAALADTTIRDTLKYASQPGIISLAGGIPNPELFPLDDVRERIGQFDDATMRRGLQYSATAGIPELRGALAKHLTQSWGREVSSDHILITTGSQQGLDIITKTFLDEGDAVLLEDPTYLAAVAVFNTNAPDFVPAALGSEGIDVSEADELMKLKKPKFAYAVPTFQNPTGIVWSPSVRQEFLAACERNDVLMVEDDPYSELYYTDHPPKPVAAYDTSGRVIYLGTFSKTLYPGLRVGFVVADPALIETFVLIKQSMDLHTSTLSQLICASCLTDSSWYDHHMQEYRSFYAKKQKELVNLLKENLPSFVEWSIPDGGLFVWLKAPGVDSRELLKKSVEAGVAFMPGYAFYAKQPQYDTLRLSFATVSYQDMEKAVKTLAETIKSTAKLVK